MNIAADLMSLLAEWRRLTEREAAAILTDDWKNVAEQQQRKLLLREAISRSRELADTVQAGNQGVRGRDADKLNAILTELMAIESQNYDVLKAKRQDRQAEFERMNEGVHNLRRVRRTYGGVHSQRWHSYS